MALHWLCFTLVSIWLASPLVNGLCDRVVSIRNNLQYSPKDLNGLLGNDGAQTLSCNEGYVLDGPKDVECINDEWKPWLGECRALPTCNSYLGRRPIWTPERGGDCVCKNVTECQKSTGQVCGTDAVTYSSVCHLEVARCEEGKMLDVAREGPCQFGGVCALPKPSGSCNAYEKRWYYNLQRSRCEQFDYGQCFLGRNVFETRHECYKRCECDVWCKQPCDPGPCKHTPTVERYYFEPEIDTCKTMRYSGCGGNENNFDSHRNCMRTCQNQKNSPAPSETCRSRHNATLSEVCNKKKSKDFLATITVDSDEVPRFGHNGYIVMVWNKFFGPSRVVADNQEFIVNYSEICPCSSLLRGEQYLISGNVTNQRLSIDDDSLIMPYTSYQDLQAAIKAEPNCQ